MALQVSLSDQNNGAPYPQAYVRAEEAKVSLAEDQVLITLVAYYSKRTADDGMAAVYTYPVFSLTKAEINAENPAFVAALGNLLASGAVKSPKDALKACLYILLSGRPEFANATNV